MSRRPTRQRRERTGATRGLRDLHLGSRRAKAAVQRAATCAQLVADDHWMGWRAIALVHRGTGWAKSLRNTWLRLAARRETVLHEARFDRRAPAPDRRLRPAVLCMSPTSSGCAQVGRVRARRPEQRARGRGRGAARRRRARALPRAARPADRDGYGQTEIGAVTGVMRGDSAPPGSLGKPLDGVDLRLDESGELLVRAASVPTFFLGYLDAAGRQEPAQLEDGWWRTGDRAYRDDDGQLWFQGRADDVIISAGYRIGPSRWNRRSARTPRCSRRPRSRGPTPSAGTSCTRWSCCSRAACRRRLSRRSCRPTASACLAHQVPALDRLRDVAAEDRIGQDHARAAARPARRSVVSCLRMAALAGAAGFAQRARRRVIAQDARGLRALRASAARARCSSTSPRARSCASPDRGSAARTGRSARASPCRPSTTTR